MKIRNTTIWMLATLLLAQMPKAQQISIGKKYKDQYLPKILGYKNASAHLSGFTGKPLLLVFWSTTCPVSLDYVQKLDSVKKDMGNKLEILLVTHQQKQLVQDALQNNERLQRLRLPVVVEDKVLKKLFPHRTAPHQVWINQKGIIKAITGHNELTKQNLINFIASKELNLPQKEEIMDNDIYFSLTPLMVNQYTKNKNKLFAYSYLGDYRPGIYSGTLAARYNPVDSVVRIKLINGSLTNLYRLAYYNMQHFHKARFIMEMPVKQIQHQLKSSFCYDLILKDTSIKNAYRYMIGDLDRSFNVKSSLQKRKIRVLVLKRTSGMDKLKAVPGRAPDAFDKNGKYIIHNGFIQPLVDYLFNYLSPLPFPVINQTGYEGNIDLELPADFSDLDGIRKALLNYDLALVEEEREMEVIVLSKYE